MQINEPISVELSEAGAPVRFIWRGITYAVTSAPEPWTARLEWWKTATRAHRGAGTRFEREMWRVDAVKLDGVDFLDGTFDLALDSGGRWMLATASDAELDSRLFA